MGYRLYVESTRQIECKGGFFNWCNDAIENLFRAYCPSFYAETSDSSEHWEINRQEFVDMINEIKKTSNFYKIPHLPIGEDISKEKFIECCEALLELSSDSSKIKDPEFIYLDWF